MSVSARVLERDHTPGWLAPERTSTWPAGIVIGERDVSRRDESGALLWTRPCAARPNAAHVSGDRLLVTTYSVDYHRWGSLGPALLLRLEDGSLVSELRGERGCAMQGGRFLLGLEGYEVFDTWLHDRDGAVLRSWRSFGHYVVDGPGSVRVIERDRRVPTRSQVVRLCADGAIERGPALVDPLASAPVVLEDGTALFVDAGVLRAVDRELRGEVVLELLAIAPRDASRYQSQLSLAGDRLSVTMVERSRDAPIDYTTYRWELELEQTENT